MSQRNMEYNRQDRNWLSSTNVEGRSDIRLEMPPDPLPSRFSDWNSIGSPCTRTSPHSSPDVRTEKNRTTREYTRSNKCTICSRD